MQLEVRAATRAWFELFFTSFGHYRTRRRGSGVREKCKLATGERDFDFFFFFFKTHRNFVQSRPPSSSSDERSSSPSGGTSPEGIIGTCAVGVSRESSMARFNSQISSVIPKDSHNQTNDSVILNFFITDR